MQLGNSYSSGSHQPPALYFVSLICCWIVLSLTGFPVSAEDWPTYHHDNQRSGITSEKLDIPLSSQWTLTPRQKPSAAWDDSPAKQDFWHFYKNLKPRSLFDKANYVSVAGSSLFFGSSSDDMVCCRDLETGEERWVFFTEGPVRFAPTLAEGKVYFGSDDGSIYCLNAENGNLIWKYNPSQKNNRIIGNGRMISVWPVRTSIVAQNKTVYGCAGIFPEEGVYLCALNAENGTVVWQKTLGVSPQGYLLSATNRLFIPTGNTNPTVYNAETGDSLGSFTQDRSGGTYALIVDDKLVSGPGYTETGTDWLYAFDTNTRARVAYFQGNHVIVTAAYSYLHTDDKLTAIDREQYFKATTAEVALKNRNDEIRKQMKKLDAQTGGVQMTAYIDELTTIQNDLKKSANAKAASLLWSVPCAHPYSLIASADLLFAGGDNEVAAYSAANGALVWKDKVDGRAYSLAIANGSLLVSTDRGVIHRFSAGASVPQWHCY